MFFIDNAIHFLYIIIVCLLKVGPTQWTYECNLPGRTVCSKLDRMAYFRGTTVTNSRHLAISNTRKETQTAYVAQINKCIDILLDTLSYTI
jgi:hypothetical protein